MAKLRQHNEYFRRVYVRQVKGQKRRSHDLIMQILSRPGNTFSYNLLAEPYETIVGEESSRKSCPSCRTKLEEGEWVWSWGEYINAKWHTVKHFCKHCYPEIRRDLEVHRSDCGCEFNLIGYGGEILPDWLTLGESCSVSK